MTLTAKFVIDRETKGAIRYAEIDEDGIVKDFDAVVIGTLYIRKKALGADVVPQALTVTVETE